MRILIIGGMHGNEPLGLAVVRLFQEYPVDGIDVLIANEKAVKANTRFTEQDLNRSFPGDTSAGVYERVRANEILEIAKGYDIVLDFHNTGCPENDCGFVGEGATQALYDAAWVLGIQRIIVADYDCINKYASNCLSVEVSMSSQLNRPEIWYERIACLSRLKRVEADATVERYRFVYRMTLEDKQRFALNEQNLVAFQPMDAQLADALGVKKPAYPIFIDDSFTPYNYGGVLHKLAE